MKTMSFYCKDYWLADDQSKGHMCTGMPVNRPEEQASTHYFVFIQIKLLLKFIARKYMFVCVCGKTLFLHAQFLLLRMTYKLKCL